MKEVFSYKLTPDNRTIEMIDLGSSLGGLRETTAAVENGELVSYCTDPATKKVDLIAKRSIDKSKYRKSSIRSRPSIILDPNFLRLVLELKHI